jgi:hypothetical protein
MPPRRITMSKAAKFFALDRREQWMVVYAIVSLWRSWIGLRTITFARLRASADGPANGPARVNRPSPDRVAWAVAVASRYVPDGSNCLVRALAAGRMLRRYGYDAALRIGVAKGQDHGLAAHAWLESGGQVVIGGFEFDRYVALAANRSAA